MKKKIFISVIVTFILIGFILAIIFNSSNKGDLDVSNQQKDNNEIIENQAGQSERNDEIERIKETINAKGKTDIYQIETEHDGRKIIQIKPEVQFDVDLAGILKDGKPEEDEIKKILEKRPIGKGIWISEQSREQFIKILKNNNLNNFIVNNDGFLKIKDENISNSIAKELKNMIESKRQYIINIKGKSYQRDYISGEIVEYPFEEMDPQQVVEIYEKDKDIILELTQNKKITDKEILETVLAYK